MDKQTGGTEQRSTHTALVLDSGDISDQQGRKLPGRRTEKMAIHHPRGKSEAGSLPPSVFTPN